MASSSPSWVLRPMVLCVISMALMVRTMGETNWCVARSNASDSFLQTAIDYACGSGADCAPIQLDGLCYLPNTMQSHASYAFNSYFQRKAMAPGSCDFAGTAAVATTDPSYGSCVYPSSASTAGGAIPASSSTPTFNNPNTPPTMPTTPTYGVGGGSGSGGGTGVGGLTPLGSTVTNTDDNSMASLSSFSLIPSTLVCVLPLLFPPI